MRRGSADLPLHGGRVPSWLGQRMTAISKVIVEAVVLEYGRDEFLRRLSHPFWFQCFGAVMGMDWHSSGITTSVMGALKRGLAPVQDELGIYVCGGRGKHSRKTPMELVAVGERVGINGDALARISKLVAKVDSACVQDGFQLYLHSFVVTTDGRWAVVQQGMNGGSKEARRYHWLSSELESFVDDPHQAIDGEPTGNIINLADYRARKNRQDQLAFLRMGPAAVMKTIESEVIPHLRMPAHHDVEAKDILPKRLHGTLRAIDERAPDDYEELLLTPGVGARTAFALAMVSEVIHGSPARFSDPARFSFAHGGKDGHPFPVPLNVYDRSIEVMRSAVETAKLEQDHKLAALKWLHTESLRAESYARGPSVEDFIHQERTKARSYGGRTVLSDGGEPKGENGSNQPPTEAQTKPAKSQQKKPQLSFGGVWQRPESAPKVPRKKAQRDADGSESQLTLFG